MTHYELLQISETASPDIIRAAYMALAKKYHPDLNRDNLAQAEEKMKQINTAYEILSDPSKRRDYDLQLRINRSSQTSRQSSYQHTQYQSNQSQTHSNASTNQHSQDQSNGYQNSQYQSKSYPPPKTKNQSPSRIKKQLVRVLIWFLCALGYGLLIATFNVLGGTLGGIPTAALAGGTILLAKLLCKKWDEHWSKKHTSSQEESQPPKKKKSKTWLWVLLLFVFVITTIAIPLCVYYYSADNTSSGSGSPSSDNKTTQSAPNSASEPKTGKILEGYERSNASSVTVVAPKNESCVVKLKDKTQNTVISFYVRAGETVTVGVPRQTLYAFFMSGTTWYGTKDLFGDKTAYRADSTGREFDKHTYIYTVYSNKAPTAAIVRNLGQTTQTPVQSTLTPVAEPTTGTILEGYERYNASEITVTASKSEACVVKLKDFWGDTLLSFYVRAGQTATIGVPEQSLYVYFASGKTWYGKENLFGESTSYSKDDDLLDFKGYTWTYTLYPVTDGNFSETPIDADEFFD